MLFLVHAFLFPIPTIFYNDSLNQLAKVCKCQAIMRELVYLNLLNSVTF